MISKFDTIFESNFSRFQGGGFLTGDVIRLKDGWQSDDWTKAAPEQMVAKLKELDGSDLLLRVSSVKTVRPAVNSSVDQAAGVEDFYIDITQETAPGRYTGDFVTLPQQLIMFDGEQDKLPRIPDSLRREEDVDIKPRELTDEDVSTGEDADPAMTNAEKQTGSDDKVNKRMTDKDIKQQGATAADSYTAQYIS
jgi:hypothetical protein